MTSPDSRFRSIGVAGAGVLSAGIAQACAQAGCQVLLFDDSEVALDEAQQRIQRGLERLEQPEAFSLVRRTTRLAGLADCDAAIEAAAEDLQAKRRLFCQLDRFVEPPKLLATSTSMLSVSRIASVAENPDRVAGMRFLHPAAATRLVEVVRAEHTCDAALRQAVELAEALGKTAVRCKDSAGFIVDRIARPFYLAALRLLEAGRGSPAAIDRAVREGGWGRGPFELLDLVGLDVDLAVSRAVWEGLGRPPRLEPSRVQEELARRGARGRRNACGFYVYGENPPGTANQDLSELAGGLGARPAEPREVLREVLRAVLQEARAVVEEGVARREDVDVAARLGLGWPRGPFEWEEELSR